VKGLTWLRGALFQTKLICCLSSAVVDKVRDVKISFLIGVYNITKYTSITHHSTASCRS
jgi:hypothetical protein